MNAAYSWPSHPGFYHRPRPGEVREQQAEIRTGLAAAADGTCKPYVVTVEKHLLEVVGPQRNRAEWAGIAGDKRRGYRIDCLSKNRLSRTRKPSVVPVRRTITAALKAVEVGAGRAAKRQTLHAGRDALVDVLLGRSTGWVPWPSKPEDQAYVMREVLRVDQDNRCAICGNFGPTMLDHDHQTGEVRGLLCGGCNADEGYAGTASEPRFIAYRADPPAARFGRGWTWPYWRDTDPPPKAVRDYFELLDDWVVPVGEDDGQDETGHRNLGW